MSWRAIGKTPSPRRSFRDSRNLAEYCRSRADEEQAKIDAERKRQRELAEQERKARQKKNKTLAILAAAAALVVIIAAVIVTQVIIPGNRYKAAEALLAEGKYDEAISAFEALGDYKDAAGHIEEAKKAIADAIEAANAAAYAQAEELMEAGDFDGARAAFAALGDYKNASMRIADVNLAEAYSIAKTYYDKEDYESAYFSFLDLGDYQDSKQQAANAWDSIRDHGQILIRMISEKEFITAQNAYDMINKYDSIYSEFQTLKANLEYLLACEGTFYQKSAYRIYEANIDIYLSYGECPPRNGPRPAPC